MPPHPPAPLPRNFALVQALRGIAAFWVVLFHASEGGHIPALKALLPHGVVAFVFDEGGNGVPIFFGLSGFVIAHSLRDAVLTPAFLGRFALRRSIRLDPPYWTSILLVIAFAHVSARVKHEDFAAPGAGVVAAHVAYLQEILRLPEINPAYWTLTYEVQFYLFLAGMLVLAAAAGRRIGRALAVELAWATFFLLAMAASLGLLDRAPHGLFVVLWKDFFVGALAYRAAADRRLATLAALLALASAMVASGLRNGGDLFPVISAGTALLLYGAVRTGRAEHGLDWRWLQFLGAISYSLYLIHSPVTGAAGFVVHRLIGPGVGADVAALAGIVAASVAAAALFWAVIERASHRWSRRVRLPAGEGPLPASRAKAEG